MALLRPDLVPIFPADIPVAELGRTSDLFFGRLAVPVGWVAIRAYFNLNADAVTALRNEFGPRQSLLCGMERLDSYIYVVDGVLVGCPVGRRLGRCESSREWRCKKEIDDGSPNGEKKRIEWHLSKQHTLLGFEMDTDKKIAKLPGAEIQLESSPVPSSELSPANYRIAVETLKRRRGLCVRWISCNFSLALLKSAD